MISASVYITVCSARNRLRVRLRRLREPRYLVGAVVGVAYLYFAAFGRGRRPGVRPGRPSDDRPAFAVVSALQVAGTSLAGLGIFVLALFAWLLPMRSGLLEFSAAETDLLFAAPVSRRQLLVHRIVRSQTGSLVGSAFVALFATPISGLARVRLAFGMWALLVTVRVYFSAVALARARLQSPVASVRRAGWVPIGLLLTALAIVGTGIGRQLMQPAASFTDFVVRLSRATSTGLPHLVLSPFIAILRPPLATNLPSFLLALAWSLAVLAAVTLWLLSNDVMLDAVVSGAGETDPGDAPLRRATVSARASWWTLPLTGRLELALLWKNAMHSIRGGSTRSWRVMLPLAGGLIGVTGAAFAVMAAGRMQGPAAFIAVLGCIAAGTATLFGPQMMRSDLRTDFEHLDLLKTWPVRPSDVIRGEMAWPALAVSGFACTGVLLAAVFSGTALPGIPFIDRWSFAFTALFAAPAMIAAQYAVHNAMTIFFPAWVQLGTQRTRGIDAMGQRLIMLTAILIALALFAVPGAAVAGVLWLIFRHVAGNAVFVPASMLFAAVVLLEVLVVTELLGPAYEKIDLTSIERGE